MMRTILIPLVLLCVLLGLPALWAPAQDSQEDRNRPGGDRRFALYGNRPTGGESLYIRVGKALTASGSPVDDAAIVISDGRIQAVGSAREIEVPEGFKVLDFSDAWACPGFVELHAHIGSGSGFRDLNDMVYQANPELRTLDVVRPDNEMFKNALAGGVTTVLHIPGSGTNMGGFGTLLKTYGKTLAEALVRHPGALKIAQAGNPERWGGDLGHGRAGMNWIIRRTLEEGRDYHRKWTDFEKGLTKIRPERVPRLEAFRGLFNREFPVAVHTQIFQVVQATMRIIHDEMGLWTVSNHSTFDGFLNAPEFGKRNIWVICGPRVYHFDWRNTGRFYGVAAEWYARGVERVGINTDSPVVPEEDLTFQAAMAVHYGLPWKKAFEAITILGARAMGIDDRVGSLEPGKDADVVIWTGDPLDVRSWVRLAIVNGRIAYDPERDGRRY